MLRHVAARVTKPHRSMTPWSSLTSPGGFRTFKAAASTTLDSAFSVVDIRREEVEAAAEAWLTTAGATKPLAVAMEASSAIAEVPFMVLAAAVLDSCQANMHGRRIRTQQGELGSHWNNSWSGYTWREHT